MLLHFWPLLHILEQFFRETTVLMACFGGLLVKLKIPIRRSELTSIDEWMHGRISYSNASFSVLVVFYLRWFILAIVLLLCVSMGLLTCDSYLVPVDWYCSPALAHRLIEPIYRPTYLITTCISLWSAFIALGLIWSLYVELCLLTHSSPELFPVSQASLQIILWKWHTF